MIIRALKRKLHIAIERIAKELLEGRLQELERKLEISTDYSSSNELLNSYLHLFLNERIRIWGEEDRTHLHPTAQLANSLLNTSSGEIWIGEYSFTGHNVSFLTGSHNTDTFLHERQALFPTNGGDIRIGRGVWIGSNALILGPCEIEDHAVVAAGSVVVPGSRIPSGAVVMGIPGRVTRFLQNLPPN